eukprot:16052-Heterococcus_DN1.PRE.7
MMVDTADTLLQHPLLWAYVIVITSDDTNTSTTSATRLRAHVNCTVIDTYVQCQGHSATWQYSASAHRTSCYYICYCCCDALAALTAAAPVELNDLLLHNGLSRKTQLDV